MKNRIQNYFKSIQMHTTKKYYLGLLFICLLNLSAYSWGVTEWPNAIRIADFILSLQNSDGAIEDEPGGGIVNEDSNMEYALIGLGAAYDVTQDVRYLTGLEKGIAWLAARQEMTDVFWKGSFHYVYSYTFPYNYIPTSPDDTAISDVRGVDATSTLFTYLIYLHKQITGSDTLVNKYAANAKAALDFVIAHNLDTDGYSWSSWQKRVSDGNWYLWKYKYAADQGDVWLGMKAGAILYDSVKYAPYANFIETNTRTHFYSSNRGRFCLGIDETGGKEWNLEGFNGIFPNGYLPWLWGSDTSTEAAYLWLQSGVKTDGSIFFNSGSKYAASVAIYGMSAYRLGKVQPTSSFLWLNKSPTAGPYDSISGGVFDTPNINESIYSNVASFSLMALMGWSPSFQSNTMMIPSAIVEKSNVLLYPNPALSTLNIKIDNRACTADKIIIHNTFGDKVAEHKFTNQINISQLPTGIYFVSLINKKHETIYSGKILVKCQN